MEVTHGCGLARLAALRACMVAVLHALRLCKWNAYCTTATCATEIIGGERVLARPIEKRLLALQLAQRTSRLLYRFARGFELLLQFLVPLLLLLVLLLMYI